MSIRKAKAWRELMKLGPRFKVIKEQVDTFFRGNVLGVLREEGWFDYLKEPRTFTEIASAFSYTDMEYLGLILDVLVEDGVLQMENDRYHFPLRDISFDWCQPRVFSEAMVELWVDHARAIPDRLRGKYMNFNSGLNLFNWDDALTSRAYEQGRRASFALAGVLKKPVRFLDVGCGNGRGTSAIWTYYYKRGHFQDPRMQIVGIDPDEKLLTIAREEFPRMVIEYNGNDPEMGKEAAKYPPVFRKGYAEKIPFEDGYFDVVFASQVLHWTRPREAVREMMRVLRPGGCLFGHENFRPGVNRYAEIHMKVVEGAYGFLTKQELEEWARENGAVRVEFATPISVFRVTKG
ncbi:MAG: methyltransferase domain-containing protein [Candidatus Thorarchaeota archaeon]